MTVAVIHQLSSEVIAFIRLVMTSEYYTVSGIITLCIIIFIPVLI